MSFHCMTVIKGWGTKKVNYMRLLVRYSRVSLQGVSKKVDISCFNINM